MTFHISEMVLKDRQSTFITQCRTNEPQGTLNGAQKYYKDSIGYSMSLMIPKAHPMIPTGNQMVPNDT